LAADATLPRFDAPSLNGAESRPYPTAAPVELRPWLLVAAFVILLTDAVAVLLLGGVLTARRTTRAAAVLLAGVLFLPHPHDALAQETPPLTVADQRAMAAANQTALAYVLTGDAENDIISRSGLY